MTSVSTDRLYGANSALAIKSPCRVATTANITLSGTQTIDGIAVVAEDRVLVKNQTTGSENGIYIAGTSTWQRAPDFDGSRDVAEGTLVKVNNGTAGQGFWYISTTGTITIGTTSITFTQASSVLAVISAFAQTLLDDADAATFLTTLGVSAFIQTLLNDADAAAARTTVGASALSTAQTFTGAQIGAVTALTSSGASIAINLATNNNFSHTMTENTTLAAPTNPVAGQSGTIVITQHASAAKTLAYNAFWKFSGGVVPTLTTTVGAVDTFSYYVESATRATCSLTKDVK